MNVPDGWRKHRFDEISFIANGQVDPKKVPYLDYVHIGPENVESGTGRLIDLKTARELCLISGKYLFDDKSIVYSKIRPNLNKVCLPGFKGICSADMYPIWPKLGVEKDYLFYFMTSSAFLKMAIEASMRTGLPKINRQDLGHIKVLLPSLPEQQKIAQILSTWDKAIEKLEALIAAKQKRKKALMQQLLTRKKRFAGFEGDWKDFHLTDVAQILVSPVDKKTIEGEKPVLLCNYTDVYYNRRITKTLQFMRATANEREISKFKIKKGDVIITKDSETPGDIAIPAFVGEDLGEVVCGYHLAILRPKKGKVDGEFLNYLLSMPKTRYYFFTLATGATRFGLSVGGIEKAHFHLPPIDEQQKIASVLSAADKEIENNQKQLSALKEQKKGLMQQLLTGKNRVKIDLKEVA